MSGRGKLTFAVLVIILLGLAWIRGPLPSPQPSPAASDEIIPGVPFPTDQDIAWAEGEYRGTLGKASPVSTQDGGSVTDGLSSKWMTITHHLKRMKASSDRWKEARARQDEGGIIEATREFEDAREGLSVLWMHADPTIQSAVSRWAKPADR